MDFFESQDRARRHTGVLVVLFALAVIGVVAAVTGVAAIVASSWMAPRHSVAVPDASWLRLNAGFLALVATATAAMILIASLVRSAEVRGGGGAVARSLGGRLLRGDTKRPEERRLLNVVEEMAIASGIPVPEVYLLDEEEGINAFAAGFTPANAAIGVTRGAVEGLSRDELQGVIAHEFSHILNGDMRLNQRLIGLLFGILLLALIGEGLLRSLRFTRVRRSRDGGKGVALVMMIALALFVIGSIGVFFGRLIKAAVSRQREYLADASAVQFTRNPPGIAGALKIIAIGPGSYLQAAKADEVSHMLFGTGRSSLKWLWATHPPLEDRIRAIEPTFEPAQLEEVEKRWRGRLARRAEGEKAAEAARAAAGAAGMGRFPLTPEGMKGAAGSVDPGRLVFAAALLSSLGEDVRRGAASEDEAPAVVLGLLVSGDDAVRAKQLAAVRASLGEAEAERVRAWGEHLAGLDPGSRLPVMDLALPALRVRPLAELDRLVDTARALILADERVEPFELALARTLAAHRDELAEPDAPAHGRRNLLALKTSAEVLVRALAGAGDAEPEEARAAYAAGIARLPGTHAQDWKPLESWPEPFETALDELRELAPRDKGKLVEAITAVIAADGRVSVEEAELLRAVCAALRVPVPPLAPAGPAAKAEGKDVS